MDVIQGTHTIQMGIRGSETLRGTWLGYFALVKTARLESEQSSSHEGSSRYSQGKQTKRKMWLPWRHKLKRDKGINNMNWTWLGHVPTTKFWLQTTVAHWKNKMAARKSLQGTQNQNRDSKGTKLPARKDSNSNEAGHKHKKEVITGISQPKWGLMMGQGHHTMWPACPKQQARTSSQSNRYS